MSLACVGSHRQTEDVHRIRSIDGMTTFETEVESTLHGVNDKLHIPQPVYIRLGQRSILLQKKTY